MVLLFYHRRLLFSFTRRFFLFHFRLCCFMHFCSAIRKCKRSAKFAFCSKASPLCILFYIFVPASPRFLTNAEHFIPVLTSTNISPVILCAQTYLPYFASHHLSVFCVQHTALPKPDKLASTFNPLRD